jgi:hypothetical protein
MKGALWGLLVLISMAITAVVWEVRRRQARQRLHEVDTGARCVACDGTDLQRAGEAARCLRCGYVASLTRIAAVRVSANDVDKLVKPDDLSNLNAP